LRMPSLANPNVWGANMVRRSAARQQNLHVLRPR
jgi:hypothetical protein